MSDLRKAAEMALELLENHVEDARCEVSICKTVAALRQALAQPEQKQYVTKVVAVHEDGTYTTERIPLPKREWVGLTDEDRSDLLTQHHGWNEFGIAIEAKLKEKNSG